MQEGDEPWSYISPNSSCIRLYGRYGIALVRDKKILSGIVIIIN